MLKDSVPVAPTKAPLVYAALPKVVPTAVAGEEGRESVSWSSEYISVVPELGITRESVLGKTSPYLLTNRAAPTVSVACCRAGLTWVSPTKK